MIGQCPGGLDDTDDSIQLMDGTRTVDSVAYTITAPWPAAAAGTGPSMELNDPALDNDVGSSWHASSNSGTPGGSELRRRIGRRRHVDGAQLRGHMEVPGDRAGPIAAWRAPAFNTDVTMAPGNPLQSAELSLIQDDGAVVYVNGVEVARSNMPTGTISFTTKAASAADDRLLSTPRQWRWPLRRVFWRGVHVFPQRM